MSKRISLETSILDLLKTWKLGDAKTKGGVLVSKKLYNEGFNTLDDLCDMTSDKLTRMDIKKDHIYIICEGIKSALQNLKSENKIEDNETKIDIEIDNNLFNTMKRRILNPYIILIGISDYSACDNNYACNLPSAKNDVKLLYQLFTKTFGYKYVNYVIDKLRNINNELETIDEDVLEDYLHHQRKNIKKINKQIRNNNESNSDSIIENEIDGLIVYYSGHGDTTRLLLGDEEMSRFNYTDLIRFFNNTNLNELRGKPKLFCFDCPHGNGIPKILQNSQSHKAVRSNGNEDILTLWGSVLRYQSFVDMNGYGNLTKAMFVTFKHLLKNSSNNSVPLSSMFLINNCVKHFSNTKQTSQIDSTLSYDLEIVPNNNNITNILGKFGLNNKTTKDNILYSENLIAEGYNDIEEIITLTLDELIEYKWHKGDAKKFIRLLKTLKQNNEEEKKEDFDDEHVYKITSPYIILISASTYDHNDELDDDPDVTQPKSLPGTKTVIQNLYNLFTDKNGYNYNKHNISLNIDQLHIGNEITSGINGKKLRKFFSYHADIIEQLNDNKDKSVHVDSLIIIYSGHGQSNGIVPTDLMNGGSVYEYDKIYNLFSNSMFEALKNLIKLYIWDNCRGDQSLSEQKENIQGMGMQTLNVKFIDEFRWYGTVNNYKSYALNDGGTIMGNALYETLKLNVKNGFSNTLQGKLCSNVQQIVSKTTKQIPEVKSYLRHGKVFLCKNEN